MRDYRKLGLALALVSVVNPLPRAGAQAFDPDLLGREGPGFKAGRLVLHPGLSLEGGYDTNLFLQNTDEEGAFILRLTGYLDVATEPPIRRREGDSNAAEPQKIEFRGGIGASYYHFFTDRIAPNMAADGHIFFAYNPSKVFTLQVNDVFLRTVRPFTNPNTADGQTTTYGRNFNTASLDLIGRSKSQVLEGKIGYTNFIEFFDSSVFNYGNSLTHRVPASLSWSFFPSSALVYVAEFSAQRYDFNNFINSATLLSDSNRIHNSIGYSGALTERFSLTAMIGYAAGFYQFGGDDYDGVIARLESIWRPRPTIALIAGYDRDFVSSFIGNFTEFNRLHLTTRFVLSGALQLGVRASVSFDKSGLALAPDGTLLGDQPYRKDIRVQVGIFGEYRFKAWLALFGQVGYLADFTDFEYAGTVPLLDPAASYKRFDAWLGLRVFY